MNYTITSTINDADVWTGAASDPIDAVRQLCTESGDEFGDDDEFQMARNPEWSPDWLVTSDDEGIWQVRLVRGLTH